MELKIAPSTLICIHNIRGTAPNLGSVYIINYFASEKVSTTNVFFNTFYNTYIDYLSTRPWDPDERENSGGEYFCSPYPITFLFRNLPNPIEFLIFLTEDRGRGEKEIENTLKGLKGNEIYITQRYCQFCDKTIKIFNFAFSKFLIFSPQPFSIEDICTVQ